MQNTLFGAGDASQFHADSSVLVHTPCQPGIRIERRVHHSDQRAFAQGLASSPASHASPYAGKIGTGDDATQGHVFGIGGCVVDITAKVQTQTDHE